MSKNSLRSICHNRARRAGEFPVA